MAASSAALSATSCGGAAPEASTALRPSSVAGSGGPLAVANASLRPFAWVQKSAAEPLAAATVDVAELDEDEDAESLPQPASAAMPSTTPSTALAVR